MKKSCIALLCAAALTLTGCASILERSYDAVSPHTNQYWEDGTSASALRVEDYQSLVNGLLMLVANQTETGVVRLYGYIDQASAVADMDLACSEVTMEDPMGTYLVEYVTYDCTEGTNCFEMTVKIAYQKTPTQVREMVNATTAGALPSLLQTALSEGRTELAVKIGYMDRSAEEIERELAEVMTAAGRTEETWSVRYYPDAGTVGDSRIVEIVWQAPEAPLLPESVTPLTLPQ